MKKSIAITTCILLAASTAQADNIANYRDDYTTVTPGTGWGYHWSANGPVGTAANYVPLTWDAGATRYDDNPGTQGGTGEGWMNVNANGGHAPRGTGDIGSLGQDGYTIHAYTIQSGEAGNIELTGMTRSGGGSGLDYRVYVNDTLIVNPAPTQNFNVRQSLGNVNVGDTVYVAIGPNGTDGSDGYQTDFTLNRTDNHNIVADYRGDFQTGTPATGWTYQSNGQAIGDSANYTDLIWSAGLNRYNGDGGDPNPRPAPNNWVSLTATGGHPGPGDTQGDASGIDRYAIAGFTIATDGNYEIFGQAGRTANGNGVDVEIYVNDALIRGYGSINIATFGESLGSLTAGDRVYVAVGPDTSDGGDSFLFDYSIAQVVPEPSTFALLTLGIVGLIRRRIRRRS